MQLYHKHLTTLDVNIIYTSQGIDVPLTSQLQNRIGDVIHSKGISFQFTLELDVTQIECHFKIFVVKRARGDLPTDGNNSGYTLGGTYLHELGAGQVDATTTNTRSGSVMKIVRTPQKNPVWVVHRLDTR